ncbi:BON domain-containing protein [Ramlibacter sp. G-1-2-2]|uniref:BON domain-containing protein n=1 Tax=Ramlibacter agri TaxID=2728837 RepID=A0A848HGK4_9BURK|nr:BON domain-containing protein [Ramlibacter agri]NML48559.1 BON domain-containing protein [Ramlibacter agri]
MKLQYPSFALRLAAIAVAASTLGGCAAVVVGAAAGTALMATDRRSSGAQVDDETIEVRSALRLSEALGDKAHINVTSYNRQVLMTGEVPSDQAKQMAETIVGRVDNVRSVVNELAVAPPSSLQQRSTDTYVTGKIRASLVDASDLQNQAFKVVTERGTVYLMGRVTPYEAERGTLIARQTSGVGKVVRMFELVTPEDLRALGITAPAAPAPAPAPVPAANPATAVPPATTTLQTESGGAVATPVR